MKGITASVSPTPLSFLPSEPKISPHFSPSFAAFPSNFKLIGTRHIGLNGSPRFEVRCSSSGRRRGSGSGDNGSRAVLDAFFLGKALAETLTERIESTIGEVLSGVGRLQAEQQKRLLDFQEEVIERANRAKEKAAREAIDIQGPVAPSIITPTNAVTSSPTTNSNTYPQAATDQDPVVPVTIDED